ncbi:SOS response-associated peptidase family protein (plasmid) [Novosphingobium sp. BL-8A]|uniref:SOS response-associated peptidase n=1 Tax=Novosphingobium sp. BL-8A TaxID=3127639 RepID=UPI0037568F9B
MCNLYRMTKPADAIAALFDAMPAVGANYVEVIAPTDPGLVVARRNIQAMAWGFPRSDSRKVTGEPLKPRAVVNTRSDKIGSPFWRTSFQRRRCLIPVTAWAEPAGQKSRMTRTWFSLPGEEVFAIAGIWCNSPEWGHVYSMLTVPGHEQMEPLNDRMPVILRCEEWQIWTDGTPTAAHELCRIWEGLLEVEPTDEPWSDRTVPQEPNTQLSLPL